MCPYHAVRLQLVTDDNRNPRALLALVLQGFLLNLSEPYIRLSRNALVLFLTFQCAIHNLAVVAASLLSRAPPSTDDTESRALRSIWPLAIELIDCLYSSLWKRHTYSFSVHPPTLSVSLSLVFLSQFVSLVTAARHGTLYTCTEQLITLSVLNNFNGRHRKKSTFRFFDRHGIYRWIRP
jgi:hypothetical protein